VILLRRIKEREKEKCHAGARRKREKDDEKFIFVGTHLTEPAVTDGVTL
jgi:hypothetical protein